MSPTFQTRIVLCLLVSLLQFGEVFSQSFIGNEDVFYRSLLRRLHPNDSLLADTAGYLANRMPDASNYRNYYNVACALWELERDSEAKKMFLTILASNELYYTNLYYHASDVPGTGARSMYGYGSYTSDYRNGASVCLTKIYIVEKKFDSALLHLNNAVNTFKVEYTCGTGSGAQHRNYRDLYGLCYEGLGMKNELLNLLLPDCFDWGNETVIRAIKNYYSKEEIRKYLKTALRSIKIKLDSELTKSFYVTRSRTEDLTYRSGKGTMMLFDRQIVLPAPEMNDGETLKKSYYQDFFIRSRFYKVLLQ